MSRNDEPVYDVDYLGHRPYVRRIGELIKTCDAPYVIGVSGSWGSGKTSFMRSLSAYLGGPIDGAAGSADKLRKEWFGSGYVKPAPPEDKAKGVHIIWFDPWKHQFEEAPLIGLLHEIRSHFSLVRKFVDKSGKVLDVTVFSILSRLDEGAKDIMERGKEYEREHFESALTSQRFREFFEKAVEAVVGKDGRLVVFIDDLDRCEGKVAFRVLEALKLYLSAKRCIYVLGIDKEHLEESIAGVLAKDGANGTRRSRSYLSKMFQNVFLLPVRKDMSYFVRETLDPTHDAFRAVLSDRLGLPDSQWPDAVVEVLDRCLPHNPRKIKGFIAAWKLYVALLSGQTAKTPGPLDWRLTVILNYLGQFEEAIFRKVEESPSFYNDVIRKFCETGGSAHALLEGLEMPDPRDREFEAGKASPPTATEAAGGFGLPPHAMQLDSDVSEGDAALVSGAGPSNPSKPGDRIFWIGGLVRQVGAVDSETLRRHLLGTV